MNKKLKPQYVVSLGASVMLVYLLLLAPHSTLAANLTWSADTTITFTGLSNLNLTVKNGSAASNFTMDASSAIVTLSSGQDFTVEDTNNKHITNSVGSSVSACTGALTRLVVHGPAQVTFNPTSLDPVCPSGGSVSLNTVSDGNNPLPQPVQQEQKTADEKKNTEQAKQESPEVKTLAKKVDVKALAGTKKQLQGIAKGDNKVSAAEKAQFGLAIAALNANLNAVGLTVAIAATTKAKPSDLVTLATAIENFEKTRTAVAKDAVKLEAAVTKEKSDQKKAKDAQARVTALFKNGLTSAEAKEGTNLLKAAGLKSVTLSTKSKSTSVLASVKAHVTLQTKEVTAAQKKVTQNTAKVTNARKSLESSVKKFSK